jgi:Fe-S cluster biogenesis protein NfuA
MTHEQTASVTVPINEQIQAVLDRDVRGYIERDGGSIRFVEFRDGIVYVEMSGTCKTCSAAMITLKAGVERHLRRALREVKEVRLYQEDSRT